MTPLSQEDLAWMEANLHEEPSRLYLRHHGDPHRLWLTMQLDCRRKAASKLTGWPVDREFIYPNTLAVEQSTSTILAVCHADMIRPGESVLDMTLGLGIDAMMTARAGAKVTALDLKEENVEAARLNSLRLGLTDITLLHGDSVEYLRDMPGRVDTIFIDPARRDSAGRRLFGLADCAPSIPDILPCAAGKAGRMIAKCSPMLDVSRTVEELAPYRSRIFVLGTTRECKELLAEVDFSATTLGAETPVTCLTPGFAPFTFTRAGEAGAEPTYSPPCEGDTLVEPFPAVVKGGGFKSFALQNSLDKISPSTHLYLNRSMESAAPLQARRYRILRVLPFGKEGIRTVQREFPQVSVATRGFRLDAETLRRRLKVRESSGDLKLWGITSPSGEAMMVVATPL